MATPEDRSFGCGIDTSDLLNKLATEPGSVTLTVPVDENDEILLKSPWRYGEAEIIVDIAADSVTIHRQDDKLMNFVRADGREGPERVLTRAVGSVAICCVDSRWCLPPDAEQPTNYIAHMNLDLLWGIVARFAILRREADKRRNSPRQSL